MDNLDQLTTQHSVSAMALTREIRSCKHTLYGVGSTCSNTSLQLLCSKLDTAAQWLKSCDFPSERGKVRNKKIAQVTKYGLLLLFIVPFCSYFHGANGNEMPCSHCLGLSIASSNLPEITQTFQQWQRNAVEFPLLKSSISWNRKRFLGKQIRLSENPGFENKAFHSIGALKILTESPKK